VHWCLKKSEKGRRSAKKAKEDIMWQPLEWFCRFLLFPLVFLSCVFVVQVSCESKMSDNRVEGLEPFTEAFTTRGPPVQQLDFTRNGEWCICFLESSLLSILFLVVLCGFET
jgi:hypothetical protein